MNAFFLSIPWDAYLGLNIIGSIVFIVIVLAAIYCLNMMMNMIKEFRRTYPPLVSRTPIRTYIPNGDECPLSILTRRVHTCTDTDYPIDYVAIIYSFAFVDTTDEPLEISSQFCEPSDKVDGLYQVVHAWPKTKFSWLRRSNPYGNNHFIFPKAWLSQAKKKDEYIANRIS